MSGLLKFIRQSLAASPKSTGSVAKDRLAVMLVHQRNSEVLSNIDMAALKKDIAEVVKQHVKIAESKPSTVCVKQDGEIDILEMLIPLEFSTARQGAKPANN